MREGTGADGSTFALTLSCVRTAIYTRASSGMRAAKHRDG
jgi:hypothetical protein